MSVSVSCLASRRRVPQWIDPGRHAEHVKEAPPQVAVHVPRSPTVDVVPRYRYPREWAPIACPRARPARKQSAQFVQTLLLAADAELAPPL